MKRRRLILVGVLAAIVVVLGATKLWYSTALKPSGGAQQAVLIASGQSPRDVAAVLAEKNLIKSAAAFSWHVRINNLGKDFKSGRFLVSGENSSPQIARQLTAAEAADNQFTIREGLTQAEIASQLGKLEIVNQREFANLKASDFAADYPFLRGLPDGASLEGFLFPDTYTVPPAATSTRDVATIFLNQFAKELAGELAADIARSGRSTFEVVTVASMAEEEVRSDTDRMIVAGIIYRRLGEGIRLDIDATTRYAVGKKPGESLTASDLNSSSPYNTRRATGLPPGPICNPGRAALLAAANPKATDYLFYLSGRDGTTRYATTYAEHNANIDKYLK